MDCVDTAAGVDKANPLRLCGSNCAEAGRHALLVGKPLGFHAVLGAVARGCTSSSLGWVDIENEREIRVACANGERVGPLHRTEIHPVGIALVGGRGIIEAVAHHDAPLSKSGSNHLVNELSARRLVQQELAGVAHRCVRRIEQELADFLRYGHATRLTQEQHVVACTLEVLSQKLRLRGFAAPIDALKRDEAGHGGLLRKTRCCQRPCSQRLCCRRLRGQRLHARRLPARAKGLSDRRPGWLDNLLRH